MSDYQILLKLIMIGDSNVGKSCILLRLIQGRFQNRHQPTLGVQFGSKIFKVRNKKVKLQIWDTAGQEAFKSITRAYYKGSIGVLLVFDLSSASSFKNVRHWLNDLKLYSHEQIRITLIGNKSDLKTKREVTEEEIQQLIKENNLERYFQTSALNGVNIEEPFLSLTDNILQSIEDGSINLNENPSIGVFKKRLPNELNPLQIIQPTQLKKQEQKCAC